MTTVVQTPPSTNRHKLSGFFGMRPSKSASPSRRSPSPGKLQQNAASKRASVHALPPAAAVSSYRSSPLGQKARPTSTVPMPQPKQSRSSPPPSRSSSYAKSDRTSPPSRRASSGSPLSPTSRSASPMYEPSKGSRLVSNEELQIMISELNNTIAIQRNRLEFASAQLGARDSLIFQFQEHKGQERSSATLSHRNFDLTDVDIEKQLPVEIDEIASLKMETEAKDKTIKALVGQLKEFDAEITRLTAENAMIQSELNQKCAEEKELLQKLDHCSQLVEATRKDTEIAKAELVLKSKKYDSKIAEMSHNLMERDRQLVEIQQEIDFLSAGSDESQGLTLASELKKARLSVSSSTVYSPSSIREAGETGDKDKTHESKSA
ncbi:hypothetical protein BC830DRAFT_1147481 [Chytriomyces sp. MP71]|nr:hypothetical protein BC830DRAFT_1147481 [Chytriomyces sp. MP71]